MSTSPTQRTLKAMKEQGRICGIVEKFNAHVGEFGIRQDLFGFIDIIALGEKQITAIQSFGQDWSGHVKKLTEERNEAVFEWLKAGGKIELWGWRKKKIRLKSGGYGKAFRWKPRVGKITLGENDELVVTEYK